MPGIRFKETMDGFLGENIGDFHDGEDYGIRHDNPIKFDVEIEIDSVDKFVQVSDHEARLRGKFYCKSLGSDKAMTIKKGRFNLFDIDPETGHRNMHYVFNFDTPDGRQYYFYGFKDMYKDELFDLVGDITTLFVKIYEGKDGTGKLYGSGVMYFRIKDPASIIKMLKSSKVIGASNLVEEYATLARFAGFFMAETLKIYIPGPRFVYFTRYNNLVLSGNLKKEGEDATKEFFFFSGKHDKGFPWGDEETMSDLALLISDGQGGHLRFGITRRSLKVLDVDLEANSYTYKGELYRITKGHSVSFSEIRDYKTGSDIEKVNAQIKITLDLHEYDKVDMTFKPIEDLAGAIPDRFEEEVGKYLTTFPLLGYFTTPYRAKVKKGTIKITDSSGESVYSIEPKSTFGEAEHGEINNLREPTMHYNYLCGIDPTGQTLYLKIGSGTLRNEREWYFKDLVDKTLGKVFQRNIKKNLLLKETIRENPSEPTVVRDDVLTLVNDHYPTAVLLRRIVKVENNGNAFYGLEEYIDAINTAPINSDRETTVAVFTYKDADKWDGSAPSEEKVLSVYNSKEKFDVLDKVIAESDFFNVLEQALAKSGKKREDFSIIIKPNFMFFYSLKDKSTYTDPTLVEHLTERIYEKGFRNIKIAEARSTLSVFFDKRDVKSVALHIGYKEGGKYKIVDLSDNLEEWDYGGKLGKHHVNKDWKSADFRISFAKNKSHSYAYYTLTIKNSYGALPMEYKFKVYHCEMGDIYEPTIDYIKHFPIHFGFIDGVVSADGPFGIFADPYPQLTMTIIGGEDIVAVDWVGSAKMGLNPMLSGYMQEAVKAFGKPRIRVKGDGRLYKFWANTPRIASFGSHMLDRHYTFGYPVYYLLSDMDPAFPAKSSESALLTELRLPFAEAREIFYKSPHHPPSWLHEAINKVIFRLWQ
ncbi:MAG TPA: DUF362 domain-containing protein [Candidatus Hypogeohydataceae bacterium YC38]|nr:DUF362 domain-containing protein [Candidatus Brocadiales bacterium]